MRKRKTNGEISVNAIAGTSVVLLGLDATPKARKGLLGFNIYRRVGDSGPFKPLSGGRDFEGVKSETPVIQAFMWGDYVANPKTKYTYRVVPIYGKPAAQKPGKKVELSITTEDPKGATHGIYFNRGVAGSQSYSRRFGKHRRWFKTEAGDEDPSKVRFQEFLRPQDVPNRAAYKWLSRGLEEALMSFIGQANGPRYSIRAAIYELTHAPAIQAFVDALETGADVKIVHHSKPVSTSRLKGGAEAKGAVTTVVYSDGRETETFKNKAIVRETTGDSVTKAANKAVAGIGLTSRKHCKAFAGMTIPRTITTISHNKFIVLLKDGKPIQVWTGSTNLTPGGIYGQSNVGHVVRDPAVAAKYLAYWEKLSTDPKKTSKKADPPDEGMRNWTVLQQPDLTGPPPPNSITPIFSPRLKKNMLDWYANQLGTAKNSVFFTAAFSVADEIFNKVTKTKKVKPGDAYLRYLLLEGIGGLLRPKYPKMAKFKQNRIAWGDTLRKPGGKEKSAQFIETLTGLNDHVNYLHTKYMLIDPLSDDPIVISGSANFSSASTTNNDENMLIIRGNTRVADMFLVEFMRIFKHFEERNQYNALPDAQKLKAEHHVPSDAWTKPYYTKDAPEKAERELFA